MVIIIAILSQCLRLASIHELIVIVVVLLLLRPKVAEVIYLGN